MTMTKIISHKSTKQAGYVLLLSTLGLSAVAGVIVVGLLTLSSLFSESTRHEMMGLKARSLAELCVEEALMEIRDDQQFSGSQTVSSSSGTCQFVVLNQGGQNRLIEAEAILGNYTRRFAVSITSINPEIEISDWGEVAEF